MPWTRASELARALACPASVVLPRDPDSGSVAASFGTELHAWKAGGEPTARVTKWLTRQDPKWTRELLWPGGIHEVLLGLSDRPLWHAGTKEDNAKVRAGLDDTWLAGEADWVDMGVPWVDDLKTGRWPGRPSTLPQLRFYGLTVARLGDTEFVALSITHWPMYPLGARPVRLTEVVDTADLEAWWRDEVEPARLRAKNDGGRTKLPGGHCRFCRAQCEHRS